MGLKGLPEASRRLMNSDNRSPPWVSSEPVSIALIRAATMESQNAFTLLMCLFCSISRGWNRQNGLVWSGVKKVMSISSAPQKTHGAIRLCPIKGFGESYFLVQRIKVHSKLNIILLRSPIWTNSTAISQIESIVKRCIRSCMSTRPLVSHLSFVQRRKCIPKQRKFFPGYLQQFQ